MMKTGEVYIYRAPHDKSNRWFLMARDTAQHTTLSYEALGLLTYLLSKPDDWRVQVGDLMKRPGKRGKTIGKNRVYAILNELKDARYIQHHIEKDDKGRIVKSNYIVYETPLPHDSDDTSPLPHHPDMDNPDMDNGDITEYRTKQNTEETKEGAPDTTSNGIPPIIVSLYEQHVTFVMDAPARQTLLAALAEVGDAHVRYGLEEMARRGKASLPYALTVARNRHSEAAAKVVAAQSTLSPDEVARRERLRQFNMELIAANRSAQEGSHDTAKAS